MATVKFRGPIYSSGPDWEEPLEKYDPDFLSRECANDPRVEKFLAELTGEALSQRLTALERRVAALERERAKDRQEIRALRNALARDREGRQAMRKELDRRSRVIPMEVGDAR